LVEKHKVTILFATPTFLQTYRRRCTPEQFQTLKYAVVGAEKLSPRVADGFKKQFGLDPLEGYGCTETSPLVSVNSEEHEFDGRKFGGTRPGTVGRPLPGVEVRIVNPDTREAVGPNEETRRPLGTRT